MYLTVYAMVQNALFPSIGSIPCHAQSNESTTLTHSAPFMSVRWLYGTKKNVFSFLGGDRLAASTF